MIARLRVLFSRFGVDGSLAVAACVALFLMALLAPVFLGEQADRLDVLNSGLGMSSEYWLGTDNLGRDIFARVLVATRLSLFLAVASTIITFSIALPAGAALALANTRVRNIGMRVVDGALAIPSLLLAIVVTAIIGPSATGALIAISISNVPGVTRLSFTLAAGAVGKDYVQAARGVGVSPVRILFRHVLPNVGDTLAVAAATSLGIAIVEIASLSFLGLGIQPPDFDWGQMLIEGVQTIFVTPAAALGPAVAIALAGIAFGFTGEAVARALNPQRMDRGGTHRWAPPAQAGLRAEPVADSVLDVRNLRVARPNADGSQTELVRGIDLTVHPGELVGVLGESGSGKTLTALAIADLLPFPLRQTSDRLTITGHSFNAPLDSAARSSFAKALATVFQDPSSSLNPAIRINRQMTESARTHLRMMGKDAEKLACENLTKVGLPAADRIMASYQHELSGGMRQRVMIAMGMMLHPKIMIADEPTTALDVTVQAQVLYELKKAVQDNRTSLLMISHDIAVISQVCERVVVMYAGRIVEDAPTAELVGNPRHPYTLALLESLPDHKTDVNMPLGTIAGAPPVAGQLPGGCSFHNRCARARAKCTTDDPALVAGAGRHSVACWYPGRREASAVLAGSER